MAKDIKVPDIGDFKAVPVIEIHVKPGDTIHAEDPLVTLESDKATMEVPAPEAGTVVEIKVKVGDKVGEGAVILTLEPAGGAKAAAPAQKAPSPQPSPQGEREKSAPSPKAGSYAGTADIACQCLVLGAGPGGYSAAFRAADLGLKTVLVERNPTLGGVCLNVGCIPSKALLHVAAIMDEAAALGAHGVEFGKPKVNLEALRAHKDKVVGKLTGGLAGMAKGRKVEVVQGVGKFLDPHHVEVQLAKGGKTTIRFEHAIIAAGSEAVKLPFIPDDPRIVDSTGALELRQIPKSMLVVGGGIIGLEMATVYSTLGSRIDVVEMLDHLMPGADRDLVNVWERKNKPRFDRIMIRTRTTAVEARKDGIYVTFEGEKAPQGEAGSSSSGEAGSSKSQPVRYDMVLVAVGRTPNGKLIAADKAGVAVSDRGFIAVDKQQRTNVSHILAIGDIVGQPMLAHKAVHEAHVAAEVAAGKKSAFDARQIPSVAYTDPEIAWAGLTETQAKEQGIKVSKAVFQWHASGRAIANGRDEGFTKLIVDDATHRVVGGGIVGTHAGDLIGEICLAIEMGAEPGDIGHTIHPHPTLGESIGMAAEVFEGTCTDVPPQRKK
jgi:dihydrolipoamide dehydrogenase